MPLSYEPMTDVGTAIREARQQQRMTIKRLAELAGVDERTVGRIERGEVTNPSKAGQIARVLRIGIYSPGDDLVSDDSRDPRLSEATFTELMAAAMAVHSREVRAAREGDQPREHRPEDTVAAGRMLLMRELPPGVRDAMENGDAVVGTDDHSHPNTGHTGGH